MTRTKDQSEMPERIWAKRLPDGAIYDAHSNAPIDAVEYIRTDLAQSVDKPVVDAEVRDAYERLQEDYKLLAEEMVYKGNSVSHWHAKGTAYKSAIGKVCDIAVKHGIKLDGRTDIADLLDAHFIRAATATKQGGE